MTVKQGTEEFVHENRDRNGGKVKKKKEKYKKRKYIEKMRKIQKARRGK